MLIKIACKPKRKDNLNSKFISCDGYFYLLRFERTKNEEQNDDHENH